MLKMELKEVVRSRSFAYEGEKQEIFTKNLAIFNENLENLWEILQNHVEFVIDNQHLEQLNVILEQLEYILVISQEPDSSDNPKLTCKLRDLLWNAKVLDMNRPSKLERKLHNQEEDENAH